MVDRQGVKIGPGAAHPWRVQHDIDHVALVR